MNMIPVSCPGCTRKLTVKEDLAGKRVKCPQCGHVLAVPAPQSPATGLAPALPSRAPARASQAAGQPSAAPTRPSQPDREAATLPPQATSDQLTSSLLETQAGTAQGDQASTTYNFLAPPQTPAELGRLGPYRVLKVLGAGGMGVVFQAEDPHLERLVALKAMLPALAADPVARQRFLREARAAASVEHEHVIHINQVGEDCGVPFLAMPLLRGESLEDRLRRDGPLPVAQILRIGREIAEGLAAAHTRGLVHRDIKPANVWLEGERGRVKILDFGLARSASGGEHLTQSGAILGTPAYMAPEQVNGLPADARSDLFSLGCVLYQAATGQPPFRGMDLISTLMAVCTEQPCPPREMNPEVPEGLSSLILQLLAKGPADRPPSARAVAEQLHALEQEATVRADSPPKAGARSAGPKRPPTASPPRPRLPLRVGGGLLLMAGIVAAVVLTLRTRQGTVVVEVSEPDVQVEIDGEEKMVLQSQKVGRVELAAGKHQLRVKRGQEELFTESFTLRSGGEEVIHARWEPRVASGEKRGPAVEESGGSGAGGRPSPFDRLRPEDIPAAERFDGQPKDLVAILGSQQHRHWDAIGDLAYSSDGKWIASAGNGEVRLWDAATMRLHKVLCSPEGAPFKTVRFVHGGQVLAAGSHCRHVELWDCDTGKYLRKLPVGVGDQGGVLAASGDGKRLLLGCLDGTLRLWDAETGKELRKIYTGDGLIFSVALDRDGRRALSVGAKERAVRIWDLETATEPRTLGQKGEAGRTTLSPDGRYALEAESGRLWDVATGKEVRRLAVSGYSVTFSPDGHRVAFAEGLVLETDGWRELTRPWVHGYAVAFSPDGRRLVSGGVEGILRLYDVEGSKELFPARGYAGLLSGLAVSPDGKHLYFGGQHSPLHRWDVGGREAPRSLNDRGIMKLALSADGRCGLTIDAQGGFPWLWDADTGQPTGRLERHKNRVAAVALSPDGRLALTTCPENDSTRVWDASTCKELRRLEGPSGAGCVAISPDGRLALTGGRGGNQGREGVYLWEVNTGKLVRQLAKGRVHDVTFSPDGSQALAAIDSSFTAWDASSGRLLRHEQMEADPDNGASLAVSADGRRMGLAMLKGRIAVWGERPGTTEREWQLPGQVGAVAFAPDGRHLVTANGNGTLYVLRLGPAAPSPGAGGGEGGRVGHWKSVR